MQEKADIVELSTLCHDYRRAVNALPRLLKQSGFVLLTETRMVSTDPFKLLGAHPSQGHVPRSQTTPLVWRTRDQDNNFQNKPRVILFISVSTQCVFNTDDIFCPRRLRANFESVPGKLSAGAPQLVKVLCVQVSLSALTQAFAHLRPPVDSTYSRSIDL